MRSGDSAPTGSPRANDRNGADAEVSAAAPNTVTVTEFLQAGDFIDKFTWNPVLYAVLYGCTKAFGKLFFSKEYLLQGNEISTHRTLLAPHG